MRPSTWFCTLTLVPVLLAVSSAAADRPDPGPIGLLGSDCNGNNVADVIEIAQDPVLDANFNGLPDICEGLSVDRLQISVSQGGTQTFLIDLTPAMAGRVYWIIGSTAGTSPGVTIGFTHVPLNFDGNKGYMAQTLARPNQGELQNTLSALDAHGRARASVTLQPDSDPALAGTVAHHAFMIIEPTGRVAVWASNPVSLELVP